MTTTTVILASDFSSRTTDVDRDTWTAGKLRHVIAALKGSPVIIVTDAHTGHALVGVELVGVTQSMNGHAELRIRDEFSVTRYLAFKLGATIVPLTETQAKWEAIGSYRREALAAITEARTNVENPDVGNWETVTLARSVYVTRTIVADGGTHRDYWTIPVVAAALV